MIEAEPEAPAVVIEGQRESNSKHQQNCQNESIDFVPKRNCNQIGQHDYGFCSDDIREDSADKKSLLAIK